MKRSNAEQSAKCLSIPIPNLTTPHRSASLFLCLYKHVYAIMHEIPSILPELGPVEEFLFVEPKLLKEKRRKIEIAVHEMKLKLSTWRTALFDFLIMTSNGTVTTTYRYKLYATH